MSPKLRKQIACELEQRERLIESARPVLGGREGEPPDEARKWAAGAVLQSFYTGVESIFKRIAVEMDG